MAAPKGNNYNKKFKTKKQRQKACQAYCEHIKQGFSDESFPLCDPQTLKIYMAEYPDDFDTDMIRDARAQRRIFWERAGIHGTLGIPIEYKDNKGKTQTATKSFNSKSYQFIMMNMFGMHIKEDVTSGGEKIDGPLIYLPKKLPENYDELTAAKPKAAAKKKVSKK